MVNYELKKVKDKIELVTDLWNSYYLKEKFFQNKIKYNDEKATNYYGDIIMYLLDTLSSIQWFINTSRQKHEFDVHIFRYIGLIQIFYIQQDLLDEILIVFSLSKANGEVRKKIRDIRNELVGHPINRDGRSNKLDSTVFCGKDLSNISIHYIKYSEGKFSGSKSIKYNTDKLVEEHLLFLNKYFCEILNRVKKDLDSYYSEVYNANNMFKSDDVNYLNKLSFFSGRFNKFYNSEVYFTNENIEMALNIVPQYDRHKFFCNYFFDELRNNIKNIIRDIGKEILKIDDYCNFSEGKYFKYIGVGELESEFDSLKRSDDNFYYFSKFYEKKQLFCIDILLEKYADDVVICSELKNMKENVNNDVEYYSSLLYLDKKLIK